MAVFAYQAYTPDGRLTSGRLDAAHEKEALEKLSHQGLVPFRAAEVKPSIWTTDISFRRRIGNADLAFILQSLSVLIEAAIPINAALRLAAEQAGTARRRRVLDELYDAVVAGSALSEAMARQPEVFRPSHVAIVRAGEMSGSLAAVLGDLCQSIERQVAVGSRLAAAAVYPAILLAMALLALTLVFFVMAPALAPLFEEQPEKMPMILTVATHARAFLKDYATLAAVLAVLVVAGLIALARSEAFKEWRDRVVLRLPLFGRMTREAEAARFARTTGMLLKSGVPMTDALSITAEALRNRVSRASLSAALESLKKGAKPVEALSAFVALSPATRSLIAIGEETNRLPEMLARAADMDERALERRIDRMMTLLTPALTILIGMGVGGLILSVMNAILSANDLAF